MKKLLKHISPLAPDDSGACSVLYEMGGITVICDAGGCAGNVCGFDEPRWSEKPSALFSAGLRDMDAILGRDDRLVEKLTKCCEQVDGRFTAIVGTPVPAVIATDYKALKRMAEKKTGLPCITVPTDGTRLYDCGEERAYMALFEEFAVKRHEVKKGRAAVIGATPLDTGFLRADKLIGNIRAMGLDEVVCIGLDSGLEEVENISSAEKLIVISPAGIRPAGYLHEKFGTEVIYAYPCLPEEVVSECKKLRGKKVLIIHEQMAANALRELIEEDNQADCATFFMAEESLSKPGDIKIAGEDDLREKTAQRGYEVIVADKFFSRALGGFEGQWIDFPHNAASGRLRQ